MNKQEYKSTVEKTVILLLICASVLMGAFRVSVMANVYAAEFDEETRKEFFARVFENTYIETEEEKKIFSYVQIPKDYYPDQKWTGDWSDMEAGGQKFAGFGCGICCLSNIYSTLTHGLATPDMMFVWSKEHTDYAPDGGKGAISWQQMKTMCEYTGLSAEVKRKPKDYETFRKNVADADTTVVLVCKYNDDKLWFYTRGHYVNLWSYDPDTDTVYVTDPSGLYNRERVQLQDVYNALKTASSAQYMCVDAPADDDTGSIHLPTVF